MTRGTDMEKKLDWNLLLSRKRPGRGAGTEGATGKSPLVRNEFGQDYSRVVFSPPFRRLSKKTQVHPFSSIDFIHNRLTHSAEVASLGQTFGLSLARFLREAGDFPEGFADIDFVNIVSAAGLAHDIGNPPFGHAGEDAIRAWAQSADWDGLGCDAGDWLEYDGNAQAFRMASNPAPRENAYFKLTYATCGTLVKYPWVIGTGTKPGKAGCFRQEADLFAGIMGELGLRKGGGFVRHPLSYLMEAADDICYRVMDIEDAVTMHILSEAKMKKVLAEVAGEGTECSIQHLRGNAMHKLCESAFEAFKANYGQIMSGEFKGALVECRAFTLKDGLEKLGQEYNLIFSERGKVATEVACYAIMDKLFSRYAKFARNLSAAKSIEALHSADRKLLEFTWSREYAEAEIAPHAGDPAWWLHAVTDHIVGMTDDYARSTAALF